MFERFTETARGVVVHAQEEARLLRHGSVGGEHLLLGLSRDGEGSIAAQALAGVGFGIDAARAAVASLHHPADDQPAQIPFTSDAKRVLERSLREAVRMGHNYIGTEHLLLGLLREQDATAFRVLLELRIEPEALREQTLGLVAARPDRRLLPYAPDVTAVLGRAADAAREEGAEQVELRHLRRAVEAP